MGGQKVVSAEAIEAQIDAIEQKRRGLMSEQIWASLVGVATSILLTVGGIVIDAGPDILRNDPEIYFNMIDWGKGAVVLLLNVAFVVWAGMKRIKCSMQLRGLRRQLEEARGKQGMDGGW